MPAKQLNEERAAIEKQKREREEQHLYLHVGVVTEANFKSHQGFDLTNWDPDNDSPSAPVIHRVLKTLTVAQFSRTLAESLKLPPEQIRLWAMVNRQNKTTRPDQPIVESDMTLEAAFNKYGSRNNAFRMWVEQSSFSIVNGKVMWPEIQSPNPGNSNSPILVFLKYFDAEAQTLKGVGHIYVKKQQKVSDMVPMILHVMQWKDGVNGLANGLAVNGIAAGTSTPTIALYEEIKHSMIEPMKPKATLQQAELQDGDIVCFQKMLSDKQTASIAQSGGYTDAKDFYDHLLNRMPIEFASKPGTQNEADGFKLALSRKMSYDQFSAKVGEYLKVNPTHLRFSTVNATTGKAKGIVKRIGSQNLYNIMKPQYGQYGNSNQRDDMLYYEVLDMSLSELDTKKSLKVTWVTEGVSKEVKSFSFPQKNAILIFSVGAI